MSRAVARFRASACRRWRWRWPPAPRPNPCCTRSRRRRARCRPADPKVVLVQQIAVAHFLERSQIVRSSENYRLDVMSNDWWGEPLRRDAEPGVDRGTGPAPAAEHGHRRQWCGFGPARRHRRGQHPTARRRRRRQSGPAGPGGGARHRADPARIAQLSLLACRRRRRACRARWRRSAPRSAGSPTASHRC